MARRHVEIVFLVKLIAAEGELLLGGIGRVLLVAWLVDHDHAIRLSFV